MRTPGLETPASTAGHDFGPLAVYGYYRIFLAAVLIGFFLVKLDSSATVGSHDPSLYLKTSIAYFIASLASSLLVRIRPVQGPSQGLLLIGIDVLALTLLVHASGGPGSYISALVVLTVAAGAILLPGRLGYLVAAIATLAMLYEQLHFALGRNLPLTAGLSQVGILGTAFFGVAFVGRQLAGRLQASERLAAQRERELAELENLATRIIQRMRTGILVVDADGRVRMTNSAAQHLLSPQPVTGHARVADLSPALASHITQWQQDPAFRGEPFRNFPSGPQVGASLAAIRLGERPATLAFLEDLTNLTQQLQQMKLASLGRLTASIAHEIRNPLSAISHAAQLLDESPAVAAEDRRLVEIMRQQSLRLDRIVENVLQLSRRQVPRQDQLELVSWLRQFRADFLALRTGDDGDIELRSPAAGHLRARFDPHQLQQVLTNLCENGLRHGRRAAGRGIVVLETDLQPHSELPLLRIYDNGPGVPADKAQNLFEPFFTTESGGTGLGLYIARELCEANRARLAWIPAGAEGNAQGCFQITFAHPGRTAN